MGEAGRRTAHAVEMSAEHKALRLAVVELIKTQAPDMPAEEVLGLMAFTLGQLIAYEERLSLTPSRAMRIVTANIEAGNRQARADMRAI